MTDNLKQRIAEAIWEAQQTIRWKIVKDRIIEENFGDDVAKCYDAAQAVLDIVTIPTDEMCSKARNFLLGLEVGITSYQDMVKHLKNCGDEIPSWMCESGYITKQEQAYCVYRLMIQPAKE